MSDKPIIVRVRGKDGTFRITNLYPHKDTLSTLKKKVQQQNNVPTEEMSIYLDAKHEKSAQRDNHTLIQNGISQNGVMVYLKYDKTKIKSKQDIEEEQRKKQIEQELGPGDNVDSLGLRHRKKNWTMKEYMALVDQHSIVVKHQKYSVASRAYVDVRAAQLFQQFLLEVAFTIQRMGFVYGTVKEGEAPDDSDSDSDSDEEQQQTKKPDPNENYDLHDFKDVTCNVIYEPLQEGDDKKTVPLLAGDPYLSKAETLAKMLGMQRVGWIFSHTETREDHFLTSDELIQAAKYQDEFGESFLTIVVSKSSDGKAKFEAFQASKQCVDLVKRGLLSIIPNLPNKLKCKYTAKIQRKETNDIDVRLLTTHVRVFRGNSSLRAGFPPLNRPLPDHKPTFERLKNVLLQRGKFPFVERISDFHILMFLTDFLDLKSDYPSLTEAVRTQNNNMAMGFSHLINAYCGIE